jgi:hypothetical protein
LAKKAVVFAEKLGIGNMMQLYGRIHNACSTTFQQMLMLKISVEISSKDIKSKSKNISSKNRKKEKKKKNA